MALGTINGIVKIRSYSGVAIGEWKAADWPIRMIAFSPNGSNLAVAGTVTNIFSIVDAASGQIRKSYRAAEEVFYSIAWAGNRRLLATGPTGLINEFDLDSTNDAPTLLKGHQAEAVAAAVHPAGQFAITSSWDNTTRLWELGVDRLRATRRIWSRYSKFSRDGARFTLQDGEFGGVSLYELAQPISCRRFSEPSLAGGRKAPLCVSFSPDGRILAAPGNESIRLLSVADGSELGRVAGTAYAGFEGDGSGLVASQHECTVRWPIQYPTAGVVRLGPPQRLSERPVNWISSNRDGVVAMSRFSSWPLLFQRGKPFRALDHLPTTSLMALSRDGRWAAAAVDMSDVAYNGIRIWDLSTGNVLRTVPGVLPFGYAFSADGNRIADNGYDALRIWNVESGRLELELPWPPDHGGQVRTAWSPDGRILATTLNQYQLGLFDSATGELLARLEDPDPQLIEWLEFSPDGSKLAVACSTHMVQLWDFRAIRAELAARGLDWNHPPLPAPREPSDPVPKFEIVEK
jgi:WD40 repeat protein